MSYSSEERAQNSRIGAHESWGRTVDRAARTANARAALEQKFLDEADGDPIRAAHIRKATYLRMAAKSAAVRSRAAEKIAAANAEMDALAAKLAERDVS